MKILDLLFWRKKSKTIKPISSDAVSFAEAPAASKSKSAITPANMKNFIVKAVGLMGGSRSQEFVSPDYDLSEIKKAAEADSYIKISLQKYSQLLFKAGYAITSQNDAAAEYIRARFRVMSFCTGTPIDVTLQELGNDVTKYSNAFLVKSRMDGAVMGGLQAKGILDTKPVGGYFRLDPTTVTIKRDKNGTVKQYQQEVENETKTFKPTDVIHFYMDREGGAAFGTPRVIAALEDVKLLRKIEGNILSLIYRFAIPLYQMKIGLPTAGLMATDTEINDAKTEVEKMAPDGILVTNERTEFHAIGAEGEALDATGYLNYFEKRCFTALNMSEAMMGRGGSKQDADSMEAQVHDTVKFIQRTMAIFIENMIINELLLEGGYNPIINEQDVVYFEFEEINLETKVKMETHALNLYQGNAIPYEEMRKNIGERADNVEESRLYANMIQQKNILEQIEAKIQGANQVAGAKQATLVVPGIGGNGKQKEPKPNGAAKSMMQPSNQYGTTSAKIKELYEAAQTDRIRTTKRNIAHYRKKFKSVYKKYADARNDICVYQEHQDLILPLVKDQLARELKKHIAQAAEAGRQKAIADSGRQIQDRSELRMVLLDEIVERQLTNLFADIKSRLKSQHERSGMEAVFDVCEYRIRFLAEYIVPKAYWYSYARTCGQLGVKKLGIDFHGSSHEKDRAAELDTKNIGVDDVPAYSAYCDCRLYIKAGDAA